MFFRIHNQWTEYVDQRSSYFNIHNQLGVGFQFPPKRPFPLCHIIPSTGPIMNGSDYPLVSAVTQRAIVRSWAQSLRMAKWAMKHHLFEKTSVENGLTQKFSGLFVLPHFRNVSRSLLIYKKISALSHTSFLATDEDLKPWVQGLGKKIKIGSNMYHYLLKEDYKKLLERFQKEPRATEARLDVLHGGISEDTQRRLFNEGGEPTMTLCYPAKLGGGR